MSLRRWLGFGRDDAEPGSGGLAEIERALGDLDVATARYIACFAYILGRVARADHEVSTEESARMARLIAERTGLQPGQAALVVEIATAHGLRHGGTDDFLVTREFTRIADRAQRLALLECLLELSASDCSIVTLEDNEVRRVASELKLEHADFIAARSSYLEHLQVLRRGAADREQ